MSASGKVLIIDDKALMEILDQNMKQQNMKATPKAKDVAAEVLHRSRMRPNFGNGGECGQSGPPGTGKTHAARILGQIVYDMGFLSMPDVIDMSATDLVGMYQGHTGPKVIELFGRTLGKVLFIDEAYRLGTKAKSGGSSSYQEEAVGEIVDCLTKPRYARKLIVVLAGSRRDMELLLPTNAGLRSRFATEVSFPALGGQQCYAYLRTCLRRQDVDIGDHDTAMDEERETVMRLFHKLGMTYGWANARDVETLAQSIVTHVYEDPEKALQKQEEHHESDSSSQGLDSDRATFAMLTKDVIGFMKTLLKQRIRGGGDN
ncbi:stage 5 sporulation protein [Grosmannia clavigera kw1407]|uniref:Stage 5 sporulation protein n=1 Tax=Grosmannia clavigera (strain kw1407 / UAMH 11150) TaxID=655863 RepID=F0XF65_GROCL|nr:stage 5 sporulation protein [Grosmannia clavigera kw1407]EFX04624.1 stage 5 sporulation protein [Grosmannia clavigera kw1407]